MVRRVTEGKSAESTVRALERGVAVLKAFGPDTPELTLAEVARRSGLSRGTADRFLSTLVELGYLGASGRRFHLRPRVLDLGFSHLSSMTLPEVAHPYLADLADTLERSTSLAVLDGDDVIYLDRVARRRILAVGVRIGSRLPAAVTSHGRILLACLPAGRLEEYLSRVQLEPRAPAAARTVDELRERIARATEQGWCLVEDELAEGVSALSAPVRDSRDKVVAAVNVAEHSAERGKRLDEVALGPLQAAVAEIESDLQLIGFRG
jgi:IclR family transcriptional regulator, pca regulon regulatory protein